MDITEIQSLCIGGRQVRVQTFNHTSHPDYKDADGMFFTTEALILINEEVAHSSYGKAILLHEVLHAIGDYCGFTTNLASTVRGRSLKTTKQRARLADDIEEMLCASFSHPLFATLTQNPHLLNFLIS